VIRLRFFRPGIERTVRLALLVALGVAGLEGATWVYRTHGEAERWREVACAARLREAACRSPLLVDSATSNEPCSALQQLGLSLDDAPSPARAFLRIETPAAAKRLRSAAPAHPASEPW